MKGISSDEFKGQNSAHVWLLLEHIVSVGGSEYIDEC